MGLDMYLSARKYVSQIDWQATNEREPGEPWVKVPEYLELIKFGEPGIDEFSESSGIEIEFPVGYWRKHNAIHRWIVANCADGVDDCKPIRLGLGSILELSALVDEVLEHKDKASSLLPTGAGFFFGGTEYDEWYYKAMERTKSILAKAKELDDKDYTLIYQASW